MTRHDLVARILVVVTALVIAGGVFVWYFDFPVSSARFRPSHLKSVSSVPSLHGKAELAILAKLGKPDQACEFTMENAVGEFRVELFNTYPPNSPRNSEILIRERTWEYPGHKLTIWFHKLGQDWVALNTCKYDNDVVF